jgi:hypothetical protein
MRRAVGEGEREKDALVGVAIGIGLETACEISLRLGRSECGDLGVAGAGGDGDSDDGEAWVREDGDVGVNERKRSSTVAGGER